MKWHTMETQNIQAPIAHAVGMRWHLPHGTSRELATVGMQWHTLEARNIRGRIAGTCIRGHPDSWLRLACNGMHCSGALAHPRTSSRKQTLATWHSRILRTSLVTQPLSFHPVRPSPYPYAPGHNDAAPTLAPGYPGGTKGKQGLPTPGHAATSTFHCMPTVASSLDVP